MPWAVPNSFPESSYIDSPTQKKVIIMIRFGSRGNPTKLCWATDNHPHLSQTNPHRASWSSIPSWSKDTGANLPMNMDWGFQLGKWGYPWFRFHLHPSKIQFTGLSDPTLDCSSQYGPWYSHSYSHKNMLHLPYFQIVGDISQYVPWNQHVSWSNPVFIYHYISHSWKYSWYYVPVSPHKYLINDLWLTIFSSCNTLAGFIVKLTIPTQ